MLCPSAPSALKALRLSGSQLAGLGLLALFAFRLWFSAVLPMTGDEAYFVLWGEHPAGGSYDHPPMVGWWLAALLDLSRSAWVLRLPALLVPPLLAVCAGWLARPYGAARARLAALLVLLQPVNVWNVLITTDTPVIVFSMLSIVAYVGALRRVARGRGAWLGHALAGALLGLAFLGKYFAALLGFAFLVHVVLVRRDRGRFLGLAVLLLAALPAPAYNLWWNSANCWVNVLFNFVNRNEGAGFHWANPLLYLVSLAYLLTPWLFAALWRQQRALGAAVRGEAPHGVEAGALFWLAVVPFALFALLSLARPVGLHWIVSFVPLPAVVAAIFLPPAQLARLVRWSAAFAALHVLALLVICALPLSTWKNTRLYDGIVLTVRTDQLLAQLPPDSAEYLLASDGYSPAATLAYSARRPVAVFGEGSLHAREDDRLTDWRAYDGRQVLIVRKSPADLADYARFFARVELRTVEVEGASFYLVLGEGFKYAAYHDVVLSRVKERFYRMPTWLPQRGCEFCARYFPAEK